MKPFGPRLLLAALMVLLMAGVLRAETPHQAAIPTTSTSDAYSQEPIRLDGAGSDAAGAKSGGSAAPRGSVLEPTRVLLALVIVVGLILLLRWFLRKVAPGGTIKGRGGVMKVLSRCAIAPKQQLLLVQVGRRLVVVGDGGAQLSAVCQITDAEEVSALLLQVGQESVSAAGRFNSIFGRARKDFDRAEDAVDGGEGIGGLDQLPAPNRDIEPPDAEGDGDGESGDSQAVIDPAIDATRQELAGLSEKVRGLAKQLGRAGR